MDLTSFFATKKTFKFWKKPLVNCKLMKSCTQNSQKTWKTWEWLTSPFISVGGLCWSILMTNIVQCSLEISLMESLNKMLASESKTTDLWWQSSSSSLPWSALLTCTMKSCQRKICDRLWDEITWITSFEYRLGWGLFLGVLYYLSGVLAEFLKC